MSIALLMDSDLEKEAAEYGLTPGDLVALQDINDNKYPSKKARYAAVVAWLRARKADQKA